MSEQGFEDKFAQLRAAYADRTGDKAAEVEALACSGSPASRDELRRLAHKIGGTAGTFGFGLVSESAGLLEAAIDEGQPEPAVRDHAGQLAAALRAMRADPPA